MTQLEQKVIPKLNSISPWVRYIDDTFATIDPDYINTTLNTPKNFHPNIKFAHELETNKSLSFLDVTVLRHNSSVETTVFHKPTHNDTYLHWNYFSLKTWKYMRNRNKYFRHRRHNSKQHKIVLTVECRLKIIVY